MSGNASGTAVAAPENCFVSFRREKSLYPLTRALKIAANGFQAKELSTKRDLILPHSLPLKYPSQHRHGIIMKKHVHPRKLRDHQKALTTWAMEFKRFLKTKAVKRSYPPEMFNREFNLKKRTPLIGAFCTFFNKVEKEGHLSAKSKCTSANAIDAEFVYDALCTRTNEPFKKSLVNVLSPELDGKTNFQGRQEDAEEFLVYLLDGLHEELLGN
ncbi:hypothetical protein BJ741DRAFT_583222 [Chytriomyces cf. hyalinus JEL632]|nr:hypothetical protein BJ741DRAFT_583222 [Chytriomyces cf. hyalinus JEL632]